MSTISSPVFDQTAVLKISEDHKNELINLAIKNIFNFMSNSWFNCSKDSKYTWLFNEKNIEAIWNDLPQQREELIRILINCISSHSYDISPLFSIEFSTQKLIQIESILLNLEDTDSDRMRRIIVPVIYSNFDYKKEILRLVELNRPQSIINCWIDLGSLNSKDEELFEFLLSNVKKSEGATELKINILNKAFDNEVICESYIKKIAASAPISLRRSVVSGITKVMQGMQSQYKYLPLGKEKDLIKIKEKLEKLENLAMLFACLNDRHILRELSLSLSVKNLPWILPAAANHPWIVKDIQRRLDREGV